MVCSDDMVMQLMLLVLIIGHFAVVHQCLDACDEILGVLSQSGHNILEFSKVHMGADIMCHSLLYSVEEGRNFCLGHSLFFFTASRHPLHMHLQEFGSQDCNSVLEVVLTDRHDAVEEEPVLQGMPKDGERVVCIFRVPVIDGQADGCSSSCQCTSNGISCDLGRLGDELLWGWFCGRVSDGQISKTGEDTKMAVSRKPSVQLSSNLGRMFLRGCSTYRCVGGVTMSALVSQHCYNTHMNSGDAFLVLGGVRQSFV